MASTLLDLTQQGDVATISDEKSIDDTLVLPSADVRSARFSLSVPSSTAKCRRVTRPSAASVRP